jgi:Flp pilus assembly protein TadG
MAHMDDPLTPVNHGRRSRQRGNAMLEGALVLPPLLMILFATIDFSIAILVKNTVQSAVREGVRYAVTGQTVGALGQDESIRTVVENNSLGFLNSTNGDSLINVTYYNPNTLAQVNGLGSNAAGNIVQVQVTGLSWVWMVPYARSSAPLQISATSMDIVEPNATGIPPPR